MKLSARLLFALALVQIAVPSAYAAATCLGLEATIVGSGGDDVLIGTDNRDVIVAFGGDDYIDAGGGDDVICAGAGNDVVVGGGGNDTVHGQSGDDNLFGDHGECFLDIADPRLLAIDRSLLNAFYACEVTLPGGNDVLLGGAGNDFLSGDEQSDRGFGGLGNDILFSGHGKYTQAVDLTVIDRLWGADGNDWLLAFGQARVYGGNDNDQLVAFGALGTLTRLFGGAGDDSLTYSGPGEGNAPFELVDNDVHMYGGPGNDRALAVTEGSVLFYGGPGDDVFTGHEGNIGSLRAYGGPGDDTMGTATAVAEAAVLDGGAGNDTLVTAAGNPLIVRGGDGDDRLYGAGNGGPGNDQMYILSSSGVHRGGPGNDQIIVDRGNAIIEGNADDDQIYNLPRFDGTISFTGTIDGGTGVDACSDSQAVLACESLQSQPPFDEEPLWLIAFDWYD